MRAAIEVERIINECGVIGRRDHPELVGTIDWLLRNGVLRAVLPGVYSLAGQAEEFETRVAAIGVRDPDAVIVGAAAARLTFWPEVKVSSVEMASPTSRSRNGPIDVRRRLIPPELIIERNGLRLSAPALTAVDLAPSTSGGSIDTVLRKRQATLPELHEALRLTRWRQGNPGRRELLLDSRDEPWSFAERQAHQELRAAGITGWQANYAVLTLGSVYYLDIAFEQQRLAVEIDGREFHGPETFDADRWRQNDIVFAGWHLLRFSADVVINQGAIFARQVERALEQWN